MVSDKNIKLLLNDEIGTYVKEQQNGKSYYRVIFQSGQTLKTEARITSYNVCYTKLCELHTHLS